MEDTGATRHGAAPRTLRGRPAGLAAAAECLRQQEGGRPRTRLQRLFGASPIRPEAETWYRGVTGEIKTGTELARLGSDWVILHAVPLGSKSTDIDHVVIGRAGVFTLNSKRHHDARIWVGARALMVNGSKQTYILKSVSEAERARNLLKDAVGFDVPVRAALVMVDIRELTIKQQPDSVTVLKLSELVRWLRRRRGVLTPEQVAAVVAAAERPETWHTSPSDADWNSDWAQFTALRREREAARWVKGAWLVVGIGCIFPVAWGFLQILPSLLGSLLG